MCPKRLTWLHISDAHIKKDGPYDSDVVLGALIKSIRRFRERDHIPNLVFFTGDVAFSGKPNEYQHASIFFERLLVELNLKKDALFVIPGNHDVDRDRGVGLKRTLETQDEADRYFSETSVHMLDRQAAFLKWHNEFFSGIRAPLQADTVSVHNVLSFGEIRLGILSINTAAFSLGDDDYGRIWIGRRQLERALQGKKERADLEIVLMHHPLDWLHPIERMEVTAELFKNSNCILRGHLHETEIYSTNGTSGSSLVLAAGASYQGSRWPNKAMFVEIHDEELRVVPIRFDNSPTPLWTIDTATFADSRDFTKFLRWKDEVSTESRGAESVSDDREKPVTSVLGHPRRFVKIEKIEVAVRKSFEQDLFVNRNGNVIYTEPRLSKVPYDAITFADIDIATSKVAEILESEKSYFISVPPECGGTLLSKRLLLEFTRNACPVELRDALSLPNYRAKLSREFSEGDCGSGSDRVLILDNFNHFRHEKLIKEIQSLGIFRRFIFIATTRRITNELPAVPIPDDELERLFVWPMSRTNIREVSSLLLDSADDRYVSAVVEKVYGDLIALSIPLTPSNVVMYVNVLQREDDFHPFNRVDIVQKYLLTALTGGDELFLGSFSSIEKVDILSEFAFVVFSNKKSYFTDKDWFEFCESYMAETLSRFSARDFLRSLEESRIVVRLRDNILFKYAFFFSFLIGRHISNHPEMIPLFLENNDGYSLEGILESIVGLMGDSTAIISHITADLEGKLNEFSSQYIPAVFDPMSRAEWKIDDDEEEVWESISREVEKGPVPAAELDLIRTSLRGEARSIDQKVRYSQLRELEYEVFRTASVLGQVLKASRGVRGTTKKRAVLAFLKTEHIAMQIGIILAREIAKRSWIQWGGVLFIGFNRQNEEKDLDTRAMMIVSAIPRSVVAKALDDLGTRKLGEVFRSALSEPSLLEPDAESFLALLLFGCVVRAKPTNWDEVARNQIKLVNRRAFYLSVMLDILMYEYKAGINTQRERDALKGLIALVHAKRGFGKAAPGARLVKGVARSLESRGAFRDADPHKLGEDANDD